MRSPTYGDLLDPLLQRLANEGRAEAAQVIERLQQERDQEHARAERLLRERNEALDALGFTDEALIIEAARVIRAERDQAHAERDAHRRELAEVRGDLALLVRGAANLSRMAERLSSGDRTPHDELITRALPPAAGKGVRHGQE